MRGFNFFFISGSKFLIISCKLSSQRKRCLGGHAKVWIKDTIKQVKYEVIFLSLTLIASIPRGNFILFLDINPLFTSWASFDHSAITIKNDSTSLFYQEKHPCSLITIKYPYEHTESMLCLSIVFKTAI